MSITEFEEARDIDRRQLLVKAAILSGSLLLDGCLKPEISQPARIATPEQISARGLAKLKEAVGGLPESVYKQFLSSRVIPVYEDNKTRLVSYGGQPIEVFSPTLIAATAQNSKFQGFYNFRHLEPPKTYHLATLPQELLIPALDLFRDSEKGLPLFKTIGADTLIRINPVVLSQVQSGLSPELSVTTPADSSRPANQGEQFDNIEKMIYIKEALNQLIFDFYIEQIIIKTRQLGLPVTMIFADVSGKNIEVEIITHCLTALHNNGGRSVAAFDIAGYLLAIKTAQGSLLQQVNLEDPNVAALVPIVERSDFGQSPGEILANVLKMTLSAPEVRRLLINGDFNKLP